MISGIVLTRLWNAKKWVAVILLVVALVAGSVPATFAIPTEKGRYGETTSAHGDRYQFYKAPYYTQNATGDWVSYVFTEEPNHYKVQAARTSIEFYDYYTKVWSENFTEVIIYDDRWTVEYQNKKGKWVDTSFYSIARNHEIVSSDELVVSRTGSTDIGSRTESYIFRVGEPCKLKIEQTCDQAQTIRFVWNLSGIVACSESEEYTQEGKQKGLAYYDSENNFIARLQWFDELSIAETIEVVTDTYAQGRKATVTFGQFSAGAGEVVVLDPLYEYYDTGDDDLAWIESTNWDAQTFTPSTAHKITSVKLKIDHLGNPPTCTVSIRASSGGLPTGGDLCSGTFDAGVLGTGVSPYPGEWTEVSLGAGYDLLADTKYAIVVSNPSGDGSNRCGWRWDSSSPSYGGGAECYSADSGSSWTERTGYDFMFEEWGEAPQPTVTTNTATSVEETTATLSANVTAINDGSIDDRGFEWDTDSGAPYSSNWTENGSWGTGEFTHGVTSLTKGELYYYRGLASNNASADWGYGSEVTFLTKPDEPNSMTAVGYNTYNTLTWAMGSGSDNITIRGQKDSYPADKDSGTLIYNGTATSCNHTSLTNGDHWYYRGWSWCGEGGKEQWSDTYDQDDAIPHTIPTVTTTANATGITASSATVSGNITDTGGINADNRGFEWGSACGSYTDNWTEAGGFGVGGFSHTIGSLSANTTYFFRAMAYNSEGWGYGSCENFTTTVAPLGAPTNFTITQIGTNSVNITWTKGVNATTTVIRVSTSRYPASPTDGYAVCNTTGTSIVDSGLSLTLLTYHYRAWSWGNPYSDDFAEGAIGGVPMILFSLVFLAAVLTIAMFMSREAMLGFPCALFWAILGGYSYTQFTTPWVDWQFYLAFGSLLGMVPFTALAAFGLREKRETIAEVEFEEGEGEYIGERKPAKEKDEIDSMFDIEGEPTPRQGEGVRERARLRRTGQYKRPRRFRWR